MTVSWRLLKDAEAEEVHPRKLHPTQRDMMVGSDLDNAEGTISCLDKYGMTCPILARSGYWASGIASL
jgi:hypothetical protein